MKNEIRGLQAGEFVSDDESCRLIIRRTDNGVVIELLDEDADIFYAFTVDKTETVKFECGDPKQI